MVCTTNFIKVYQACSGTTGQCLHELASEWDDSRIGAPKRGTLIREDLDKGNTINNFRSITLQNTELKILDKGLAKSLARVADGLIG